MFIIIGLSLWDGYHYRAFIIGCIAFVAFIIGFILIKGFHCKTYIIVGILL